MADKTLDNQNVTQAQRAVSDLKVFGDGDTWKLLCKASSESQGWMKSTKVLEIPDIGCGCLVQVTTQQRTANGGWVIAEAVTYVPGVRFTVEDGVPRLRGR